MLTASILTLRYAATLHYPYTTLHYTTPKRRYTSLQYATLHVLHSTTTTTTLRYTTLHPVVVGEVITATIPKSITPTTFPSVSGFALPSMHHNNSPRL